ncbi:MAG: carboxypeptidase-like regulatory domain-containing protein, partial [Candidatus Dojkabacteria bacterium]|nr:carboxypeptidase-like regulatory domain-containing protein [Candidatus Dojkabacteria bacterium]
YTVGRQKLLETAVTNINGVFSFEPSKGIYEIVIQHGGYRFPSRIISGNTDGVRRNVYNGGAYEVLDDRAPVRMYVPLDKLTQSPFRRYFVTFSSKLAELFMLVSPLLMLTGLGLALYNYLTIRDVVHLLILTAHLTLMTAYLLMWIEEQGKWGHVKDMDGNPVAGVTLSLYDRTYGKLVDTRVSDEKGRFRFVELGGQYLLKVEGRDWILAEKGFESGYIVGGSETKQQLIARNVIVRHAQW